MPREKRFFVTLAEVISADAPEEHRHNPAQQQQQKNHHPIKVHCSCEEEHASWIRDCARQERQRLSQQREVREIVTKVMHALHRNMY
jgi:hypothetical protein